MVCNKLYRCLCLAAFAVAAQAQIRGPMLGFVWDGRQEAIRPVLGIAGSSTLGRGLNLPFAVKHAAISPNQDFVIALGGDARSPYWVDLRPVEPVSQPLADLPANADRIVMSPRGLSAAIFYSDPKRLYVIGGLPTNPAVVRQVDLATDGMPSLAAVADDASTVLAAYPESRLLVTIDENGNFLRFPEEMEVRSIAFLEGARNALAATDRGVLQIDSNGIVGTVYASSAVKAISSSSDGKRALIADADSAVVIEVVLESGERRQADCPCTLSAVSRISQGIFRLNEISSSPLWLVEVLDTGLRTIFVPPDPEP